MPRPRKFDHDEAIRLHAKGMSLAEIGRRLGASDTSVSRAVNPDYRERADAKAIERLRSQRQPCKGGCGKLVWTHTKGHNGKPRTGYCTACFVEHERPIKHGTESGYDRKCRCHLCRQAATVAKRRRRQKTRVPCSHGCGRMVDSINRRDPGKPPECRPCSHRRVMQERQAAA